MLVSASVFVHSARSATGIYHTINFQGKVVKTDGTNVTNGSYTFLFCLYTTASPTTPCTSGANNDAVWRESKSLSATDGIFQTNLGDTTTLPGSVDFNSDNLYLGINFNSDGQMTPLVRFTAAPYAFNAERVNGLTVTNSTGTLTIPNSKTVSFGGAFSTGANDVTFNTGGTTSVTLPLSGTLLTNTETANQTITSTQTTGTAFSIADATNITAATTGLSIALSGTGAFDQTGLSFNLTNASGTNLNDIVGSGSTWKVSTGGVGTFTSLIANAGTTTNPALAFANSTNTGFFSVSAGTISFANAGTEFWRINSGGKLFQNVAANASSAFGVAGVTTSTAASAQAVDFGTVNTLTPAGGTLATFTEQLNTQSFAAASTGTVTTAFGVFNQIGSQAGSTLSVGTYNGDVVTAPVWAGSGTIGDYYAFRAYDPVQGVTATSNIYGLTSQVSAAGGSGLHFNVNASGTAPNYFNGSVGIGANDPDTKLTVVSPDHTSDQIRLRSFRTPIVANDVIGGLDFMSNDTNLTAPGTVVSSIQSVVPANVANHTAAVLTSDIVFKSTTGTTFSELMRIQGNGNVTVSAVTATDDQIIVAPATGGGARFAGTLTSSDLTGARTWTFQDNSGVVPLATAGNTVFFTTTAPTNVTLPTSGTLMTNPMTTLGDVLYGGASGVPTRLGGSAGFLKSTGAVAPTWSAVTLGTDTSGNYVANAQTSALTGLTGGSAGSAGASLNLAFDYSATLAGNPALAANAEVFGTTGLLFEGATADNNETLLTVADPTADQTITLPNATGTVLLNAETANQTVTSTQTTGTAFSIADATNITAATTGLSIALTGTGAFDQTGLSFNLTNASGTNLNDILGTGSTWKVSRAGAGSFAGMLSANGGVSVNGALTYTNGVGLINVANATNFTGVAGETGIGIQVKPTFTLTEPASGTYTQYGQIIDMSGIAVTAGVGNSEVSGISILGNTDTDVTTVEGVDIANTVATTANQVAIKIGTNWDTFLSTGSIGISGAGAITGATGVSSTTGTFSSAIAANGGITFDNTTDTVGSFTSAGTILMNTNILQDIGNTGTDFVAGTGALTLAGVLSANGGISLSASQSLSAAALSFVDLGLITHSTTANQGLRLPNAASATPSNPTSGEGYLAWDAAGNQLITYNGSAWTTVGGGGGYNLVKDETTSLTARTTLAFLGAGVTCADNAGQTECTISGGAGSDLQGTYNADADGGNATISLTAADGGLVFTNPASAGTGSAFLLQLSQQNTTAAVVALDISQSSNAANGVNITANAIDGEDALKVTATGLTTGNALRIAVADPSGTFKGDLINASSTNHTYMSLDNRELTIGGHKNNITISGVTDVFVYDTASDMDGGKWTDGARAKAASWYNETLDDASSPCNIATMDRCGQRAFPNKSIIVANATNVYIFDAQDNTMWMRFDKGATTTENMIGPTSNSTVSTVFALNGKVYVGNAGSVGQMYSINFISDIAKRYNSTDDYQSNTDVALRNSAVTWTSSVGQPLPGVVISDINGTVINGRVYIAVALEPTNGSANGSASIIDETDQTILNFGIAANNTASKNVFLTTAGDFYATIGNATTNAASTNYFLKAKHLIFNLPQNTNNNAFSEIYGNTGSGATQYGVSIVDAAFGSITFTNGLAPVDSTFVPQSLFVTQGTSINNGRSNTIYIGNSDNLMVLNEKQDPTVAVLNTGSVKYYTKDYITDMLVSDVRGFWPLSATGSLNDASVKANAALTNNGAATFISGVRGTAGSFNGTTQYLSLADNTALSVTGSVAFGGWFKTTSASTNQFIVSKNGSYTLEVTATGKVQAVITGTTTGTRISTNSIDTAGWHHVVAVYNASALTLDIYLDGVLTNGALSGTVPAAITDSAGAFNIGANAGATFFSGQIDDVFVTADMLTSQQVKYMYRIGSRALNNHISDTLQNINGSSSQVNAVAVNLEGGTIFVGTAGGGVTEIGGDTDTQVSTYTTSGPADDTGANFANATINSLSVGRGYGTGALLAFGNGAGVWLESENTGVKDFLSQSYNPFGNTLVQSNLNVDNVFRVTNQLSTRLDNLAGLSSPQIGLYEYFRADANGAAANTFKSISGALNLQATGDPDVNFLDSNGTTRAVIQVAGPYGNGADGAVTLSSGTNNINTTSLMGIGGRTFADGIAYRVNAPVVNDTVLTRFANTYNLNNGIVTGDELLLINLQGSVNANDAVDVGKYQFVRVKSVTPSAITLNNRVDFKFTSATAGNQKVIVQRVPNYTNVTLTGTATITASAYDGLTTLPTGNAGFPTGIVAFRANGTISVGTGTSINTTGKGYRGGAGGASGANGGLSGETVDSQTLVSGSGIGVAGSGATVPLVGFGGGKGGDGTTAVAGDGAVTLRGGGGGGGSSGSGASTAGGGGGAGAGYGTAGGGGGGSGSTASSAGGSQQTNAGGGGGGTDTGGTGGAGGTNAAGATATGGTGLGVGGTIGTATTNASGGGGSANAVGGGAGGGGGAGYGAAALSTLFLGSGGGGGGGSTDTATAGGAGGAGGGIIMLFGDTITVTSTGAINAKGSAGVAGNTNSGSGGSGSGGSIYIQGRAVTLGSSLVDASAVAGTAKVGKGGGGGGGGVGRITTVSGSVAVSGTTTPAVAGAVTNVNDYGAIIVRATNVQGSDLAENYTTGDLGIEPGDVVEIADARVTTDGGEEIVPKGVLRKAHDPYSRKIVGVISTDPGVLIGNGGSESDMTDQRKLALTGRVPIKVSMENGPIRIGDFLTASSRPGVAMKATKAGAVVAQAMENYDNPDPSFAGLITGFVKASYFNGVSLADYTHALQTSASDQSGLATTLLAQFAAEKSAAATADPNATISEILTDRVAAGVEIITPKITTQEIDLEKIVATVPSISLNLQADGSFTVNNAEKAPVITFDDQGNGTFNGTLTAKKIKADSIEGLQIFTDQVSSLSKAYAGLAAAVQSGSQLPVGTVAGGAASAGAPATETPTFKSATVTLDMNVLGKLFATGGIVVGGDAQFDGHTIFKDGVSFEKTPTFNGDTAGFAVIAAGQQSVDVTFGQAYANQPIVAVSLTNDQNPLAGDATKDPQLAKDVALAESDFVGAYFDGDIRYLVTKKSAGGFTVTLNKAAPRDLQFSWVALAVTDAKTAHSNDQSPVTTPPAVTAP